MALLQKGIASALNAAGEGPAVAPGVTPPVEVDGISAFTFWDPTCEMFSGAKMRYQTLGQGLYPFLCCCSPYEKSHQLLMPGPQKPHLVEAFS